MKRLRIYPIIILTILLLAVYLPKTYKDIFANRIDYTKVYYSPTHKEFIKLTILKGKNRKIIYSNIDGSKKFTQDEYKAMLPFMYYSDLIKIDKFPEEFSIFAQDYRTIRRETGFVKIRPQKINKEYVNLYPLIESKPKYSALKLPKDLFRLDKKGITFITTNTNIIDVNKSKYYNDEFLKLGAIFPLKNAFGNPTTRKSFDEGYFITDSNNQLFHLKRVDDKAQIKKVETNGIKIKYILVKEHPKKEFYGLAISQKSQVYLIMYGDYEFVKMPIKDYDLRNKIFKLYTTPINRVLSVEYINRDKNEKVIETIVTNLDYEKQKEFKYTYSLNRGNLYENIKEFVFPFTIKTSLKQKSYVTVSFIDINIKSFILFFLIAILYLAFIKQNKREIKEHIIPAILIVVGGVYSIITLILFRKFIKGYK